MLLTMLKMIPHSILCLPSTLLQYIFLFCRHAFSTFLCSVAVLQHLFLWWAIRFIIWCMAHDIHSCQACHCYFPETLVLIRIICVCISFPLDESDFCFASCYDKLLKSCFLFLLSLRRFMLRLPPFNAQQLRFGLNQLQESGNFDVNEDNNG